MNVSTGIFHLGSLKLRVTLMTLAIFVLATWTLFGYATRVIRDDTQQQLGEQLFSTASIVASQINEEVEDRLQGLEKYAQGRLPKELTDNAKEIQLRLEQSPTIRSMFNGGLFVTDSRGTTIASVPETSPRVGINFMERDHVATALKEGRTAVSKLAIGKVLGHPVVSMATPIRNASGNVIGALVGVIDLSQPNFLDRLTGNRYGKTGGYVLASLRDRLTITATDKDRIMAAFPAIGINPLFDRYLAGFEGFGRVVDARGVEVLSAAKQIPAAGWLLVARIPTEEAFAPIRDSRAKVLVAAMLMPLFAGALTWWMLRRQLSPMLDAANILSKLTNTDHPVQPLPIASQDEIGELIAGFNSLLAKLAQREEHLKESQRLLMESQSIAGLGSYELDISTGLWSSSAILDNLFGIDESYVRSVKGWEALIHPDDRQRMARYFSDHVIGQKQIFDELYRIVRCSDHAERWVHGLGKLELDSQGKPRTMRGTIQDISERKRADDRIQTLAFSDPLTNLPNRRLLMDRLEQAMAGALRYGHNDALLFVDLDNFKSLNDTLGHDVGDELLKQVAQRFTTIVRAEDTVARLGGDEFVVVLQGLNSEPQSAAKQAQVVAEKILDVLGQTYQIKGHGHHSTASIGVTLYGGTLRENISEPLKRAELAMYQAKAAGRNSWRFFDPEMQTTVTARASLEAELHEAVNSAQFVLHYQPQGGTQARLKGVEALVRWQHPERGIVTPAEFIPVAESSGLILPLGRWVLESACKQLVAWTERTELTGLTMAVNVSARQFRQGDFVQQVESILDATGANPKRLKLELTESVLVDNVEDIIIKMNALKARGVGFSLDDFGTGYSSLSYLKRLPLDQLKIDKGFVRDILCDPNDAAIAKMVIALADSLGLEVLAEGVETEAQRDFLASLGCTNYQGYLFSQPLPVEEFEAFALALAQHQSHTFRSGSGSCLDGKLAP